MLKLEVMKQQCKKLERNSIKLSLRFLRILIGLVIRGRVLDFHRVPIWTELTTNFFFLFRSTTSFYTDHF